jgi:hypothetical protein
MSKKCVVVSYKGRRAVNWDKNSHRACALCHIEQMTKNLYPSYLTYSPFNVRVLLSPVPVGSPRSTCRGGQRLPPPPSPPQTTTTAMRTAWWTPARPRRSTKSPPGSRGPTLWRGRRLRATGCTSGRRPGPLARRHHCQCSTGQVRHQTTTPLKGHILNQCEGD